VKRRKKKVNFEKKKKKPAIIVADQSYREGILYTSHVKPGEIGSWK
jgi:hypothetical protein